MRRVEPHWLWLGNAGDVDDRARLRVMRIVALVDLAVTNEVLRAPRESAYCRFPLVDGPGNPRWLLHTAVHCIASLIRANTATLIYCGAGLSRTPALCAAGLSVATARDPAACLLEITRGAHADVHPSLWNDVLASIKDPLQSVGFPN